MDNTVYCIAAIYDTLCRKDITLDWLEKSQENGDVALMDIVIVNWMESVRSDPRFKTILAELGLAKFISG